MIGLVLIFLMWSALAKYPRIKNGRNTIVLEIDNVYPIKFIYPIISARAKLTDIMCKGLKFLTKKVMYLQNINDNKYQSVMYGRTKKSIEKAFLDKTQTAETHITCQTTSVSNILMLLEFNLLRFVDLLKYPDIKTNRGM